jgi:hypothetical protein
MVPGVTPDTAVISMIYRVICVDDDFLMAIISQQCCGMKLDGSMKRIMVLTHYPCAWQMMLLL